MIKAPTLSDVASRANVSKVAVSTVLNGSRCGTRVSEETRKRIVATAHDMGYRVNASAKAIRTGRSSCAVLLMTTRAYYSALPVRLLDGIHDGLAAQGMHLAFARVPDERLQDEELLPKFLRECMADGLIINYTHDLPPQLTELIAQHQIPSVWTNIKLESDCVHPDDFDGGVRATERLLSQGHRAIAYAALVPSEHYSRPDRIAGYEQAMRAAGQTPAVWTSLAGVAMHRVSAVVANGDTEAQRLLSAARLSGRKVPEDLSVVVITQQAEPPEDYATEKRIAAWLLPEYEMGRRATEMLTMKINHPAVALPCESLPLTYVPGSTSTIY
ncbi:MAG: LacI family DNA-binding transcriptional regulator [Akkermansiaceae bacterium]|nr:LacI family DNA-binding transcriptional regulator [Armatimonadota bacterium]